MFFPCRFYMFCSLYLMRKTRGFFLNFSRLSTVFPEIGNPNLDGLLLNKFLTCNQKHLTGKAMN